MEDSIKLANIFIDNWVRKRVVLSQAELNLSDYQKDVEAELETYKSDLIIYKFERELIKQKLDTVIHSKEIEDYYSENIEMFKLKDYALQVIYVSHPVNFEETKELKELVRNYSSQDSLDLATLCDAPDFMCFQKTRDWIYLKDLLSEVPLTIYNEERFLKKDKFVDFEEGNRRYLLKVNDFKLKDSYSPIDLEKRNIKSLILNSRKIKLLEKMREELFQKALNNGEIEINK